MAKKKVKKVPEVVDDPTTPEVDESVEEVEVAEGEGEVDGAAIEQAASDLDAKREAASNAKAAADEAKAVADAAARDLAEAEQAAKDAEDATSLDPRKFIALDVSGTGSYSIHPMPEGYRQGSRTIKVFDKTFEHVTEHRGVWAYRHLG